MQITISSLPTFEAMIFKYLSAYFKHLFTANTRHGTHSPFVYKLADEVIYDFSSKKVYSELLEQRKKLLNDPSTKKLSVHNRSKQLQNPRLLALVYRIAKFHQPTHILELNTNLGFSVSYLAKACPEANICTLAEQPLLAKLVQSSLADLGINHVNLRLGENTVQFKSAIAEVGHLGMVYFNNSSINFDYFEQCLSKVNEESILIFEDMYRTVESARNWESIKKHDKVTVTIDLFSIGFVYFRKGQAKEHFKLKF